MCGIQLAMPSGPAQPTSQQAGDEPDMFNQELEMYQEYKLLGPQAARGTTSALGGASPSQGIGLDALGYRFAKSLTKQNVRLPRRIDFEEAGVDVLAPYLKFGEFTASLMRTLC